MNINIEILENGCVIIDESIVVAKDLSIHEIQGLVREYENIGTKATVYTPEALEFKWNRPGLVVTNFARLGIGGTMGYMSSTLVKISENFAILKEENLIQLSDFRTAV